VFTAATGISRLGSTGAEEAKRTAGRFAASPEDTAEGAI
jgi:hypothetical protein